MPSTYSSNLRLELIASGEQANTWGNTTNTNLGTLLEEAITGNVQIDISAGDKVLTALNGAYDQARAMVIIATGAAGVTRVITTPANVSKVYILHNDSTTDVTIKTAASGTPLGVTVPAGAAKLVYTDGTDFFEGVNSADTLEATTVTAGTVTATSVITTTAAASTVTISGAVTNNTDAATKLYVDNAVAGASGGIPSGTVMLFVQATAPAGWTKLATQDDKALRIVSGSTGGTSSGSVAFSSAFALQAVTGSISLAGLTAANHTLSTSQIPSHTHSVSDPGHTHQYGAANNGPGTYGLIAGGGAFSLGSTLTTLSSGTGVSIAATGGGGAHSHSVTGTASFTGNSINLAVQYVDVIQCSRN